MDAKDETKKESKEPTVEIDEIKLIDFSKMKKSKKKGDKKKKSKKSKKKESELFTEDNSEQGTFTLAKPEFLENWVEPYNYDYLLDRINGILSRNKKAPSNNSFLIRHP